jgi:hypothetical protein
MLLHVSDCIPLEQVPEGCPQCHAPTNFLWTHMPDDAGEGLAGRYVELCYCLKGCGWAVEIDTEEVTLQ